MTISPPPSCSPFQFEEFGLGLVPARKYKKIRAEFIYIKKRERICILQKYFKIAFDYDTNVEKKGKPPDLNSIPIWGHWLLIL